jgi:protein-tyrosine phosphatase
MNQIKVLFVCMGNICRSPTAEGVFRHLIKELGTDDRFMVDSAGTHAYHVGEQPDHRAQQTARSRGIDLSFIRARKFSQSDFEEFDHILAMDSDNFGILYSACPDDLKHKVQLFLDYAPHQAERNVPDPYYGGQNGFEHVFDLVEEASRGFHKKVIDSK